jgi:hypothetical protein
LATQRVAATTSDRFKTRRYTGIVPIGRMLITLGLVLVIAGVLLTFAGRLPFRLGRLPGDIYIHGKNSSFYFPLATCIVLSVLFSLIMWLFRR